MNLPHESPSSSRRQNVSPGRTKSIAELGGIYPTLCELTALDAPNHLESESIATVLKQPGTSSDSHALSQYSRFSDKYIGRALRINRYRFVAWEEEKNGRVVHRELYDRHVDADEIKKVFGAIRPRRKPSQSLSGS